VCIYYYTMSAKTTTTVTSSDEAQHTSITGIFIYGLPSLGDDISEELDKIERIFKGDKTINYLFGVSKLEERFESFHLHSKTWYDEKTLCEGTGSYIFKEDVDTDTVSIKDNVTTSKKMKMKKIYNISCYKSEICKGCHYPIRNEKNEYTMPYAKDRSTTCSDYCRFCKPDWSCCCCGEPAYTPKAGSEEVTERLSRFKYLACESCMIDREKQEHWRNNGSGSTVKETESSYVERKHLCDEAIARIQKRMGGKPPEPREDSTPFGVCIIMDDLLNPESQFYWPYGMSSLEYLKLQVQRKFDNPLTESFGYMGVGAEYDDDWEDVEVTDELVEQCQTDIESALEKYPTRDDLPKEISFEGKTMRLIPDIHGFTCDNGRCQAIFQSGRLDPVFLPMYTSREGDLDGEPSELTYGFERCIACLTS